jgi:hypothetical protein
MATTTVQDIRRWLARADEDDEFMVVVCDTFDYEDYPVFCTASECIERVEDPGSMQRVMEVYDLSMDLEAQLRERRAWHPPSA